ncbi:MAG TPA: carboxy-S-adenosyl-L-methionine synthase CmoA [Myxococcota bacterium]|nr:carboxy-S-adenosyl-L-methionine synthase CmoA [Myxococcota bacterium]
MSHSKETDATCARDRVFAGERSPVDFQFGEETAAVFDDMVSRSVPFYGEVQRMCAELASDFAVAGTNLYDLGCSTGTTLLELDSVVGPGVRFVGVDNSPEILERARRKLAERELAHPYELIERDLHHGLVLENASAVIMILTLQFVRPLHRLRVVADIARGLNDQGCLILVEKLTTPHTVFNRMFIKHYYDLKRRNGYSEMEIAQKREALENILIPYHLDENRDLLLASGFRHFEVFFRWYNFCGMIAMK